MTRNHMNLIFTRPNLAAYAVGILYGDVEEVALSRCLIVGTGCLKKMSEVIEFMRQFLYLLPTFAASP
jgi:hypothetical protein